MSSPLWRHPVTWRHREHAQSIARRQVYIGCPLKPFSYMASFPSPKVAIVIIHDDVISDVITPGSTIHEDHIHAPYRGTLCSSIIQFCQELPEKKHFKGKSVTSPLWRHPLTWRHREHAQSIAYRQVPIGCTLKPSRYLATFPRYLAPKFRQWLYVMTSSVMSLDPDRLSVRSI